MIFAIVQCKFDIFSLMVALAILIQCYLYVSSWLVNCLQEESQKNLLEIVKNWKHRKTIKFCVEKRRNLINWVILNVRIWILHLILNQRLTCELWKRLQSSASVIFPSILSVTITEISTVCSFLRSQSSPEWNFATCPIFPLYQQSHSHKFRWKLTRDNDRQLKTIDEFMVKLLKFQDEI